MPPKKKPLSDEEREVVCAVVPWLCALLLGETIHVSTYFNIGSPPGKSYMHGKLSERRVRICNLFGGSCRISEVNERKRNRDIVPLYVSYFADYSWCGL